MAALLMDVSYAHLSGKVIGQLFMDTTNQVQQKQYFSE